MSTTDKGNLPHAYLPKVDKRHTPMIYGDFREVVEARIRKIQTDEPRNAEVGRFFEYLLTTVNPDAYRRIQRFHLDPANTDPNSDTAKYIDPVTWFESKVRIARALGLHKMPPQRILDLGTGPGHFAVVARFYGHEVLGTDLPPRTPGRFDNDLYEDLCAVYGVKRIFHVIENGVPLGNLGGPYDLVTAFLAAFNVDRTLRPWNLDAWNFFLRNIGQDVLVPGGGLYMNLARGKLTDDVWKYLSGLSKWSVEPTRQVYICDFPGPCSLGR